MKLKLTLASLAAATVLLPTATVLGQTTGTSHPEQLNDQITTTPDISGPHYVKPSPYVPAASTAPADGLQAMPEAQTADTAPASMPAPGSMQASEQTAGVRRMLTPADPDAGIVTSAPDLPGQVNEGTILRALLQTPLSTSESKFGDTFLASVAVPVTRDGVVLIPAGSQIRGRISSVHGGRRISGHAAIRLQPDFIVFPDGTAHRLYAQVVGIDNFADAHVNSEGTIVGTDHPKAALAGVGLTTASATVAGAVIGGGIGAGVGAIVGAGAGTIWWLRRDVQQELPAGTGLDFSLDQPLNVGVATTAQLAN